ncbi:protein-glutamine gamma-glutamyltransferase [Halobacillus andaensis]|uniref:Protein-glutamine gamma-glutamyltransferase n=1 Tax=Halobacillus andaensis TaxID=1176239 RepID=A0A917B0Y0_HALAA|nr:protein-glutamine gamma-glutamyltransferase [Halobacillus andaensis]MBP2003810.1 protein-glutamine gamma-glutamyltransferase [Halobacillus andaensis]GGF13424.1 protein-glutamine gamma-glutamyltransferase [Halobacillus andaensis]
MIQVAGVPFQQNDIGTMDSREQMIIRQMLDSPAVYTYGSRNELIFEVKLRKEIVKSAELMNGSQVEFATFETTRSNPDYWLLSGYGALRLRPGVRPSAAIKDIFTNSDRYAFECAGAMLIIYYHAVLNVLGESNFNRIFPDLYIYSWHADSDLGLYPTYINRFLPGDVVYFDNPGFDPRAPQWRGENAIVVGKDLYFGHGLGIMTAKEMIETLNELRHPMSTQSAYLTNLVVRPSFRHLQQFAVTTRNGAVRKYQPAMILHDENSISYDRYRYFFSKVFKR